MTPDPASSPNLCVTVTSCAFATVKRRSRSHVTRASQAFSASRRTDSGHRDRRRACRRRHPRRGALSRGCESESKRHRSRAARAGARGCPRQPSGGPEPRRTRPGRRARARLLSAWLVQLQGLRRGRRRRPQSNPPVAQPRRRRSEPARPPDEPLRLQMRLQILQRGPRERPQVYAEPLSGSSLVLVSGAASVDERRPAGRQRSRTRLAAPCHPDGCCGLHPTRDQPRLRRRDSASKTHRCLWRNRRLSRKVKGSEDGG